MWANIMPWWHHIYPEGPPETGPVFRERRLVLSLEYLHIASCALPDWILIRYTAPSEHNTAFFQCSFHVFRIARIPPENRSNRDRSTGRTL